MRRATYAALLTVSVGLLVVPFILSRPDGDSWSEVETGVEGEFPPAIAKKLAQRARYAPDLTGTLEGEGRGSAAQDWLEHATPGDDIPYLALVGSRQGWNLLRARPGGGGGKWTPFGPTYGKGADNPYRDRSVYNAGTDNFGGRTIAAEIDPHCVAGDCRLWIANANGGVWRTDDALTAEPD